MCITIKTTIVVSILYLAMSANAGTWRDDFNEKELRHWTPMGKGFTWETKDGFLHVIDVKPSRVCLLEFLKLTVSSVPHRKLTIVVTDIRTARSGGFGIALGKTFTDIPGAPFFYVFFTHRIYGRRFKGTGCSRPFTNWLPRCPGTRWGTRELKQMKLIFDEGRFQMYADGEMRADFEDAHFDRIELIGFVLWGNLEFPGAQGWADSFVISGPSIPSVDVNLRGRLAYIWGDIKRR